jgi:hypothetical protein
MCGFIERLAAARGGGTVNFYRDGGWAVPVCAISQPSPSDPSPGLVPSPGGERSGSRARDL